ncbi:MAG: hypothetical protein HY036_08000 [Nitrospirae bacterium]|nr:hypothetical protein [Nitrospirota bacterium]MBI3352507.1 hypothetical protein [Nitrospirota bacterium]
MRLILVLGWIFVFVFILMTFFLSLFKRKFPKDAIEKGSDMVLDEVCRVYVPKERAKFLKFKGRDRYFCSRACEEKFLAQAGK